MLKYNHYIMVKRWTPGEVNYVSQNMNERQRPNERIRSRAAKRNGKEETHSMDEKKNLMLQTTIHIASQCLWMKWGANAFWSIHDSNEMNLEWEYNAFNKQRVHNEDNNIENLQLWDIYLCISLPAPISLSLSRFLLPLFPVSSSPWMFICSRLVSNWRRITSMENVNKRMKTRYWNVCEYHAVVQTKASELNSIFETLFFNA